MYYPLVYFRIFMLAFNMHLLRNSLTLGTVLTTDRQFLCISRSPLLFNPEYCWAPFLDGNNVVTFQGNMVVKGKPEEGL